MRKGDESRVGDLLLRTEASVAIGTGHVMRCLALAQAWQDAGGHAVFAMASCTDPLERRLRFEGFETARASVQVGSPADASETARLAHKHDAAWVVVDGYEFGSEYQANLKSRGLKVVFVDDNGHAAHYSADLVLNQNIHASEALYSNREASTRLLLGPEFAMLRREFVAWRNWKRETPVVGRKVLLTMGGSDPDNITRRVIEAIEQVDIEELRVIAVAGGNNPHLASLASSVAGSRHGFQILSNVTNMPGIDFLGRSSDFGGWNRLLGILCSRPSGSPGSSRGESDRQRQGLARGRSRETGARRITLRGRRDGATNYLPCELDLGAGISLPNRTHFGGRRRGGPGHIDTQGGRRVLNSRRNRDLTSGCPFGRHEYDS